MLYTVVWRAAAEASLAELWVEAADRQGIAEAADRLDTLLGSDPHGTGESRTATTRVAFQGSLGVLYEIDDADRRVAVLNIWRCRPFSDNA
jgi:plasmid stabilization system protein ParE